MGKGSRAELGRRPAVSGGERSHESSGAARGAAGCRSASGSLPAAQGRPAGRQRGGRAPGLFSARLSEALRAAGPEPTADQVTAISGSAPAPPCSAVHLHKQVRTALCRAVRPRHRAK